MPKVQSLHSLFRKPPMPTEHCYKPIFVLFGKVEKYAVFDSYSFKIRSANQSFFYSYA